MGFRGKWVMLAMCFYAAFHMSILSQCVHAEAKEITAAPDITTSPETISADVVPGIDVEKDAGTQTMALASGGTELGGGNFFNNLLQVNSNFTGAAAFSVPIEVPPGRNGVAPNLALNYDALVTTQAALAAEIG